MIKLIYVSVFLSDSNVPYQNRVALRMQDTENHLEVAREFAEEIRKENGLIYIRYEVYERIYDNVPLHIDIINLKEQILKDFNENIHLQTKDIIAKKYGIKRENASILRKEILNRFFGKI
jgi:hypothetical protein